MQITCERAGERQERWDRNRYRQSAPLMGRWWLMHIYKRKAEEKDEEEKNKKFVLENTLKRDGNARERGDAKQFFSFDKLLIVYFGRIIFQFHKCNDKSLWAFSFNFREREKHCRKRNKRKTTFRRIRVDYRTHTHKHTCTAGGWTSSWLSNEKG